MTDSSGSPPRDGHAARARLSVIWNAGFTAFRDLLQLGVTLLLVRILPAEAYGQFGFVTAVIGFLTLCSFREFLNHVLLVRDEREVRYQDHFSAGLAIQLVVFTVANLIAVALRWTPSYASASPLFHVMSVIFLLDLPSELRVKMLERALDWPRLRLLHAVGLVAGAGLAVSLALSGLGVYALLVPSLVVPLPFIYDLFVREGWRPTWEWDSARFRPARVFGTQRIAAVSLAGITPLVESSWCAKVIGFAMLGIFGRAIGLSQLVCGRVTGILSTAIYPVLARIEPRTPAYRRASALYLRSVAWTILPLAVLGAYLAEPAVRVLYGERWLSVIPLVPAALAAVALAGLAQTAYMLLLAHHQQGRCFVADAWRLGGTVGALAVLLPFGLHAYMWGLVVVNLAALAIVVDGLQRDGALSARGLMTATVPPACAAAAAAVVVWMSSHVLSSATGAIDWPVVIVRVSLFVATYVTVLRVGFGTALHELVSVFPGQREIAKLLRLPAVAVSSES